MRNIVYGRLADLREALAEAVASFRRTDALTPIHLIVPNNLLGRQLMTWLAIRLDGHAGLRAMTLPDLARTLALTPEEVSVQAAGGLTEARAYQAATQALPAQGHFHSLAHTRGLARLMRSARRHLQQTGLTVDEVASRVRPLASPLLLEKLRDVSFIDSRVAELFRRGNLLAEGEIAARACERTGTLGDGALFFFGLYDLSGFQRQFVQALAADPGRTMLWFSPAAWQSEPNAFGYARPVSEWIEGEVGFAPLFIQHDEADHKDPIPARQRIFEEAPPSAPPEGSPLLERGIRITAAPGIFAEARELAREVCRAVADGAAFNDMAVLLYDPDSYAEPVLAALRRAGIPFHAPGMRAWGNTPLGRGLTQLLALRTDNYPRGIVMQLAGSGLLAQQRLVPAEYRQHWTPAHWELLARAWGIREGIDVWRERIEIGIRDVLAIHGEARATLRLRALGHYDPTTVVARAAALLSLLNAFDGLLSRIPDRGPWSQMVEATQLAIREFFDHPDAGALADHILTLSQMERLQPDVSVVEFAEAVRERLNDPVPSDRRLGDGSLLVASVLATRGMSFRRVFIPGLSDGVVPRIPHEDAVLLDDERMAINELISGDPAGPLPLNLRGPAARVHHDKTLFRLCLESAEESVWLSFPHIDEITGKERLPSPFLLRVIERVAGQRVKVSDLRKCPAVDWVEVGRVAPRVRSQATSQIERQLFDVQQILRSKDRAAVAAVSRFGRFSLAAIRSEIERWAPSVFTAYDGIVGPAVAKNPKPLAATSVERFASCPYKYFLQGVLNLNPPEKPADLLAVSPQIRGQLVHQILEHFYAQGSNPERSIQELAVSELDAFESTHATGATVFWLAQRREIESDLVEYVSRQDAAAFVPTAFEYAFGWKESDAPLRLGATIGGAVSFRGFIDRVDISSDGRSGRVVDYKTGQVPEGLKPNDIQGGRALQIPLYIQAAARAFPAVEQWRGEYDFCTGRQGYQVIGFEDSPDLRQQVTEVIGRFAQAQASGQFPFIPGKQCTFCDFVEICGPGRDAAFARKVNDPNVAFLMRDPEMDRHEDVPQ